MVYPTSTQPSSSTTCPPTLFGTPLVRSRMVVSSIDNPQTSSINPILFGAPLVRSTSVTNPTEINQTSTTHPILFGTPLVRSTSGQNPVEIPRASTFRAGLLGTSFLRSTSVTNSISTSQARNTALERAPNTSSMDSTIISTRRFQPSMSSSPSPTQWISLYPPNNQFPVMPTPSIPQNFFNSYSGFFHIAHPALRNQFLGSSSAPSPLSAPSSFPWHGFMSTNNIYISLNLIYAGLASWLRTCFPLPLQISSEQMAVQNPNISAERRGLARTYRCSRCQLDFPSHQAYGGHMSFHSKQDKRMYERGESSRARPCKRPSNEPGSSSRLNLERGESSRARPCKRPRQEPGGSNCLNDPGGNSGNINLSQVQEEKESQEYEDPGEDGVEQENPPAGHPRGDKAAPK